MSRIRDFLKRNWFYLVALLLPMAIAVVRSLIIQSWIVGKGNIITGDLQAQIIPICYEFWDKIHSGDSLFYTWHLTDGVDFNALSGYLMSPFMLLMLLFPRNCIPQFMEFTLLMKWALCTWSMVYFFYHTSHNRIKKHKEVVALFLGLAYGLSNAVISYTIYVQFMDVLICFPLLLLLVEKMAQEGKWKLYYLVLAFCIISNNYVAFQVCLFLVFWFGLQMGSGITHKFKKFMIFAGSSVLAAATAIGPVLIGLSLAQGRLGQTSKTKEYIFGLVIDGTEFLKQLFVFTPISAASNRSPNIYFSVIAVFLILLFPAVKMSRKRKAYMLAMAVVFLVSFFSGAASIVWHLFNVPNGVYHRFMYLFVFYMLFMVLCILNHIEDIRLQHVIVSFVLCLGMFVYVFFTLETYQTVIIYLATILLFVLYFMIMVLYCRKSISASAILVVIAVLGIGELSANAYNAIAYCDDVVYFGENGFMNKGCDLLEQAELDKGERITLANPTSDLGMMTGQNTDSGFISAINTNNKNLHERLGMASNSKVEFLTRGASPLVNLIFNIRYGLGESAMLFSDATEIASDEYMQLYRMERLAGLGYMVNADITDWDYKDKNCFQFQNDFVNKAVQGEDIFEPAVIEQVTCGDFFGNEYERDEAYVENGIYSYDIENKNGNEYDSLQMTLYASEDQDLYMYMWSEDNYKIQIFIDGEKKQEDIRSFVQSTYHIGNVKKGQRIAVCAVPADNFEVGKKTNIMFSFAKFNEVNYAKAYKELSKNVYQIETEKSDYLKGTIHADESGIMMTSVQAVKGFSVYVDGKKTDYKTIADTMIGVPLDKGDHVVEFKYRTPYFVMGWSLSAGFFVLYLIISIVTVQRKRQQRKDGEE